MKLYEFKKQLSQLKSLMFQLPNGSLVPAHFHVTEVGKVTKHFIDCGGVERIEEIVSFQLWNADDYDHRLHPEKLSEIIQLAQDRLNIEDLLIEVEYQNNTIGKYGVEFNQTHFVLTSTLTACLAEDTCGVPDKKTTIQVNNNNCAPGSGCC